MLTSHFWVYPSGSSSFYEFIWNAERERQAERCSIHDWLLKYPQQPGLGHLRARSADSIRLDDRSPSTWTFKCGLPGNTARGTWNQEGNCSRLDSGLSCMGSWQPQLQPTPLCWAVRSSIRQSVFCVYLWESGFKSWDSDLEPCNLSFMAVWELGWVVASKVPPEVVR